MLAYGKGRWAVSQTHIMIPSVVIKGFLRWQRGYNIFAEAGLKFYAHLVLVLTMSILERVGCAL